MSLLSSDVWLDFKVFRVALGGGVCTLLKSIMTTIEMSRREIKANTGRNGNRGPIFEVRNPINNSRDIRTTGITTKITGDPDCMRK